MSINKSITENQKEEPSADDLQLYHKVENSPVGTWKMYPATGVGVEENISQHWQNIIELRGRVKHSLATHCFIEALSIRLQIIDYWLRLFFSNRATPGQKREREFGRLLKQVFDLGLSKELYEDLLEFNKHRINAIHGYVVGTTSYMIIKKVAIESDELLKTSVIFVIRNSGIVVTTRDQLVANPGALTLHVEWFCKEVREGKYY
ncbi:MAG: hypothetical protein IPN68_17465 [Bacteroidetes bacterium]|nr:hypothetical protein [Bacteroidota bacterium]